ncbi:MAG: DNA cytosine methyltransferase, partial [Gammaproteobacteria bacterium]|nr:DNA cytosine methyltransferase [Gammaproteobacteria bacterium]
TLDNDRVKGITENKDGFRPHQGGEGKWGISELGRILKPEASKTGTVTASHAPKMLVDRDKSYCIDAAYINKKIPDTYSKPEIKSNYIQWDSTGKGYGSQDQRAYYLDGKHGTLSSNNGGSKVKIAKVENLTYRKLTPLECERLQTLPDGYTDHVSKTQRYITIGASWTVDVIAHIFKGLKQDNMK